MVKLSALINVLKCPACSSWEDWKVYNEGSNYQIPIIDALDREVISCELKDGHVVVTVKK